MKTIILSLILLMSCSKDDSREKFDNASSMNLHNALKAKDYGLVSMMKREQTLTKKKINKKDTSGSPAFFSLFTDFDETDSEIEEQSRIDAIKDMIAAGAEIDALNERGKSALSIAVKNGDINGTKVLVNALKEQGKLSQHLEVKYAGKTLCETVISRSYQSMIEILECSLQEEVIEE